LLRTAKVGIGLSPELEDLVLELLRSIRADIARLDGKERRLGK
jgi:hypothetical protein